MGRIVHVKSVCINREVAGLHRAAIRAATSPTDPTQVVNPSAASVAARLKQCGVFIGKQIQAAE